MTLYHYCCRHSARKITKRGFLRPMIGAEMFGCDLIWLTDQCEPDRDGLGLTSHQLDCDRLDYQYIVEVQPEQVTRWVGSDLRHRMYREIGFEAFEHGRNPATWYIATRPLWAQRNEDYRSPAPLVRPATRIHVDLDR